MNCYTPSTGVHIARLGTTNRPADLSNRPLQLQRHEFVNFRSKLKGQLIEHLPAETRDDHPHRIFRIDATLLEVEELVFPYLACGRFVLHVCCWLPHLHHSRRLVFAPRENHHLDQDTHFTKRHHRTHNSCRQLVRARYFNTIQRRGFEASHACLSLIHI